MCVINVRHRLQVWNIEDWDDLREFSQMQGLMLEFFFLMMVNMWQETFNGRIMEKHNLIHPLNDESNGYHSNQYIKCQSSYVSVSPSA